MKALCLILCLSPIVFASCKNRTKLEILAAAVHLATDNLLKQSQRSTDAFEEAELARLEALAQKELKYNDPKTKTLISRWEDAEEEVLSLKEKLDLAIREGDFFYAYAEKKRDAIVDDDLRDRMSQAIAQRKTAYSESCVATYQKISQLKSFILQGKDVFIALEIAGVLNAMDERIVSLRRIAKKAVDVSNEVRKLHDEASKILELELG